MRDLFEQEQQCWQEPLAPGAVVLRNFAAAHVQQLMEAIDRVTAAAPFRHMETPGGYRMSVAMTSCGELGWTTDRTGYRYATADPLSGLPWPPLPTIFQTLARDAAVAAGFPDFKPDACLINRYSVGSKLSLHQDKDERDLSQPVVSVSLGLPADFQFGGLRRSDKTQRVKLTHSDVVVWGGPARLRYHGILTLKQGQHPEVGAYRLNLTFRKAGQS